MTTSFFRRRPPALATLVVLAMLVLTSPTAQACAVCFGRDASSDQTTSAISMAILFMLGVVVAVLLSFGAFMGYLMYKSSQASQVDEGLDELAEAAYRANRAHPDTTA